MDQYPYKNQIFLVGRHQGARRFVSLGQHHIKSVGSHCGALHKEDIRRLGLICFFRIWQRLFAICKPNGDLGNGGEAVLEGGRETG